MIMKGDGGANTLNGGSEPDVIYGRGGDDSLWGGTGDDTIFGGAGNDIITDNRDGGDYLDGGSGIDVLTISFITWFGGSSAHNFAFDSSGASQVTPTGSTAVNFERLNFTGGDLNDTISGGDFNDTLRGWQGNDSLSGGRGGDFLIGDNGSDTLLGGDGDDYILGGGHADTIYGGAGDDTLRGSSAGDVFGGDDFLVGGAGADHLIGGNGGATDISYADSDAGVFVDLTQRIAYGGHAQGDTFAGGFRSITGSAFADYLVGGVNQYGGDGDDRLLAGHGTNILNGGAGADRFAFQFNKSILFSFPTIEDYEQGTDRLDVSLVDAREKRAGDQAFVFIGTAEFSGAAGEIRYETGGGGTIIELNTNRDTAANYWFYLDGEYTLTGAEFVL